MRVLYDLLDIFIQKFDSVFDSGMDTFIKHFENVELLFNIGSDVSIVLFIYKKVPILHAFEGFLIVH